MHPTPTLRRWGIVFLACIAAAAAVAGERPSASRVAPALVERLETWLNRHMSLPRRPDAPRIAPLSPDAAAAILGPPPLGFGAARAFYDPDGETVFLVGEWSADNPEDVGVLLHELVHHRQAGRTYACPGARELPAYRAQEAWLAERGLVLDVNWLAIVLAAGCTPKDIHPD